MRATFSEHIGTDGVNNERLVQQSVCHASQGREHRGNCQCIGQSGLAWPKKTEVRSIVAVASLKVEHRDLPAVSLNFKGVTCGWIYLYSISINIDSWHLV